MVCEENCNLISTGISEKSTKYCGIELNLKWPH